MSTNIRVATIEDAILLGKGVGRRLLDTAVNAARAQQLKSITLTTFAHVPWNAPWYSRLGFEGDFGDARLAAIVQVELARGLPRRCAMRKTLG